MQEPYRYEILPLDTPDDDPRWASYVDIFNLGFLSRRSAHVGVETYRSHRRHDGATLGMVTTEGPGLDGRQPVAGFASVPSTINSGAGLTPALIVNTIAVRPSHRRRGLLTEMMEQQLSTARERGMAVAVLTASEATIYGRFGFAVCNRISSVEIDCRRFALRDDVDIAPGPVEFVDPQFLEPHFERITRAHQLAHRGAVGRMRTNALTSTGSWDSEDEGPSRSLRAVVHFDQDGMPDGFATYKQKGWDEEPITCEVRQVCSPTPAIDRALWQALVSVDLVERLKYGSAHPEDPLSLALTDPWAVQTRSSEDAVWLRILDLERAVAERGFEGDGDIVLGISDPMRWFGGTWRLTVRDGRGTIAPSRDQPEVTLSIGSLSRMWFGDRTAAVLAQAGLVDGPAEAVRELSRIFATALPPVNLSNF